MPPVASSNLPICCRIAPVNAPFSWPKSTLSTRSCGIAARFTATNGPSGDGPWRCSSRASNSLPVPLSPSTSTVAVSGATRRTRSITSCSARLGPTMNSRSVVSEASADSTCTCRVSDCRSRARATSARTVSAPADLGREVERAQLHRFDRGVDVGLGAGDDHFGEVEVLARDAQRLERRDARLREIHEQHVHFLARQHAQRRLAAGGAQDPAIDAQRIGQRLAPGIVLIDQQHRRRAGGHRGRILRGWAFGPAGRIAHSAAVPRAACLDTCTRPILYEGCRPPGGPDVDDLAQSSRRRRPAHRPLGARQGPPGRSPSRPAAAVLLGPALRARAPARPGEAAGPSKKPRPPPSRPAPDPATTFIPLSSLKR